MKGYKPTVLIIDDDYYTVECLRTLIDWDKVGMQPVAYAYDGMTALQLLDTWQPDVLITDISMPVLSGLDLAGRARQQYEGLYIILLTAFEDFHYVKRGLELGADAYLVKQIDYDALSGELKNHVEKALEKRDIRRRQAALQAAENTLIDQLISAWLHENDPVKLERLICLDAFQPLMKEEAVSVLLCDFSAMPAGSQDILSAMQAADVDLAEASLWLQEHGSHYPVFHPSRHAVGLIAPPDICTGLLKNLLRQYDTRCSKKPYVAIGIPVTTVQAPKSLQQAELAICATILALTGSINTPVQLQDYHPDATLPALVRFSRQWVTCIFDAIDALATVNTTETLRLAKKIDSDGWHTALFLLRTCLTILPPRHPFPLLLSDQLRLWETDSKQTLKDDDVLAERLQTTVSRWLQEESSSAAKPPSLQIKKMMTWVRQHIEDNPSLGNVAETFYLTPNHVGKLFHKETGEYFSDYILRIKLERSCEYLENPSLRIYEIAERLGFRNLSHFHAKFHEKYGCSPGNWRKGHP